MPLGYALEEEEEEDLSHLETWEKDWPIFFNPLKYEVIRISKWNPPLPPTQIAGEWQG